MGQVPIAKITFIIAFTIASPFIAFALLLIIDASLAAISLVVTLAFVVTSLVTLIFAITSLVALTTTSCVFTLLTLTLVAMPSTSTQHILCAFLPDALTFNISFA